jgi:hypothetical protein
LRSALEARDVSIRAFQRRDRRVIYQTISLLIHSSTMAPYAEEPKADTRVEFIQYDGKTTYSHWSDYFHRYECAVVKNFVIPERAEY